MATQATRTPRSVPVRPRMTVIRKNAGATRTGILPSRNERVMREEDRLSWLVRSREDARKRMAEAGCGPARSGLPMRPLAVQSDLARFIALVRRELGARDANVFEAAEAPIPADESLELRCALPDGQVVVVRYDTPPSDPEAMRRRLEMLASTFDVVVEEASAGVRSRPPAGRLLREELRTLCERAASVNALVIDANSPILWGAAWPRGVAPETGAGFGPETDDAGPQPDDQVSVAATSRRALEAVRALVDLAALRKGQRGRHV